MDAIIETACGLDVHQASVVACVIRGGPKRASEKQVRTFGTTTRELLSLRDWLQGLGCTHVGMEATGVYWRPVYAVLEGAFSLIVGNAHHIKNVPGRKTDVCDAEWLASLVRHGLIRASFVPPKPLRELRDLLRYRRKLVEGRSAEKNRLLKLLELANIKLGSFVSNVFGVSGMAMLRALVRGEQTSAEIAQLAKGRLRAKLGELEAALEGKVEEHHRFLIEMHLRRLGEFDAHLELLDGRIDQKLMPYREHVERLTQIPGVDKQVASVVIAEIGPDMSPFKSAAHLAAWAGVCPGNNESAGKRRQAPARKGNVHVVTALVEAAVASSRVAGSYFREKFYRLKARRGHKRAVVAVAHRILTAIYAMLSTGAHYRELGADYLDRLDRNRVTSNLVSRLRRLGFDVTLAPTTGEPQPSD
jgi:transposase